jgi:hypothetical protein
MVEALAITASPEFCLSRLATPPESSCGPYRSLLAFIWTTAVSMACVIEPKGRLGPTRASSQSYRSGSIEMARRRFVLSLRGIEPQPGDCEV